VLETWLGKQPVAEDYVVDMFGQQPEALLALPEGGLRTAPLPAYLGVAQLSLHGRDEPGQPVFEDEIMGSGLHDRGGGLLAHCSGDKDERHVQAVVPQHLQCFLRAERRQVVVADHDVRGAGRQRLGDSLDRLHTLVRHLDATAAQVSDHQQGVVVAVLDDQYPDRGHARLSAGHSGAGWLISSQYIPSRLAALRKSLNTTGLRTKLLAPSR